MKRRLLLSLTAGLSAWATSLRARRLARPAADLIGLAFAVPELVLMHFDELGWWAATRGAADRMRQHDRPSAADGAARATRNFEAVMP